MLTNFKMFLESRNLIDEEHDRMGMLSHMTNHHLKLMQLFEEKMNKDIEFKKYVLTPMEVDRNLFTLTKVPKKMPHGVVRVLSDEHEENELYNVTIEIMNKYLNSKHFNNKRFDKNFNK